MGRARVVSPRTWGIASFGVLASAAFLALIRTEAGGSDAGQAFVADFPAVLTAGVASVVALWAALRFGRHESMRRQWMLIALGMASMFVAEALYTFYEVVLRQEVPFPSIADVFYLLPFLLWGIGLLLALRSMRGCVNLKPPLVLGAAMAGFSTAALWAPVFAPVVGDTEAPVLERILSVLYPVGDFWLLLFPAWALAVALATLGTGRLAWPWWTVVAGFALIAASDILFALAVSNDTYTSGMLLDAGWWLGYTAIAAGASLVVDVQRPRHLGERQ